MKMQGTQNRQKSLGEEDKVGGLTFPDLKTCYKTTVINQSS